MKTTIPNRTDVKYAIIFEFKPWLEGRDPHNPRRKLNNGSYEYAARKLANILAPYKGNFSDYRHNGQTAKITFSTPEMYAHFTRYILKKVRTQAAPLASTRVEKIDKRERISKEEELSTLVTETEERGLPSFDEVKEEFFGRRGSGKPL